MYVLLLLLLSYCYYKNTCYFCFFFQDKFTVVKDFLYIFPQSFFLQKSHEEL